MISVDELLALIGDPESTRVERKRSISDPDDIRQAICAFANDLPGSGKPGYVLVGVENDGRPARLPVTDKLLLQLAQMKDDGKIQPIPSLVVEKLVLPGGDEVAVVEVQPSGAPPVRVSGVTWVRPGPRRGKATVEEEKRLSERRVAGSRPFDQRPCQGASLSDLDLNLFRSTYLPNAVAPEVLAENQRTVEDQLASLRFLDIATRLPTNAGVLVFGRDPTAFIPGAWVSLVRFQGNALDCPIRLDKSLRGPLSKLLRDLEDLLTLNIQSARVPDQGMRFREQADYPLLALRELAFNAVAHRSYDASNAPVRISWFDDRVEIVNPGGLYGQVTPENFGRVADYRNPTLAEAMKVLGYVDRFGTGVARVKSALQANGNPQAEYVFEETHVLALIRRRV